MWLTPQHQDFTAGRSIYLRKHRIIFIIHVYCYDILADQLQREAPQASPPTLSRTTTASSHLPRETVDHLQRRGYQALSERG